jgi:hypothetical protein
MIFPKIVSLGFPYPWLQRFAFHYSYGKVALEWRMIFGKN